ncbi:MAG: KAP family NTPase [Coriobacteriales bacterium]|jgi:hypothetical protein|nr:KAP family NTPase [Coriobacteriales bacterium]
MAGQDEAAQQETEQGQEQAIQPKLVLNADNEEDNQGNPVKDKLDREHMVGAIADAVMNVATPFTLGIYGGWGSGKTHFLRSVQQSIDGRAGKDSGDCRFITVWYEAWQHQREENPVISLLTCAYQEMSLPKAAKEAVGEMLGSLFMTITDCLPEFEAGLSYGDSATGVGASVKAKIFPQKVRKTYAANKAAIQKRKFKEVEEQTKLKKRFNEVLDEITGYDDRTHRYKYTLVFFIDDLDRCLPETVIEMLEKIKLFMWHPQCVFVLGADDRMVEYAIQKVKNYNESEGRGAETARFYLEKIVQFPFRLPPLSETAYKKFLDKQLENYHYADKDVVKDVFYTACDEAKASLRHTMQLANSFLLNDFLVRKSFESSGSSVKYDARITAVVTALGVLWQEIFSLLCGSGEKRGKNLSEFFQSSKGEGSQAKQGGDGVGTIQRTREEFWDRIEQELPRLLYEARKVKAPSSAEFRSYVEFLVASVSSDEADGDSKKGDVVWSKQAGGDYVSKAGCTWYKKIPEIADEYRVSDGSIEETARYIRTNRGLVGEAGLIVTLDGYAWRVLDVLEGRALLLAEQIIGYGPLDTGRERERYIYKWADCSLKKELNSIKWLSEYLPELLRSGLLYEQTPSDCIQDGDGYGELGNVFLLSNRDVSGDGYLRDDRSRRAQTLTGLGGWWWLRSPGYKTIGAAGVGYDGVVYAGGFDYGSISGIRPALWLNLPS